MEEKTSLLLGLFITAIVLANLIGGKVSDFGLFEASVAIFLYPVTFLVTDIIEEVHGKEKTKQFVKIGFICMVFALVATSLAVYLPFAERSFVQGNYTEVLGMSLRIFIASIVSFLISQTHDVWAFNFWKEKTKGKHLWIRNNLSTMVSQFIDTMLFMFLAFYAVSPKFTVAYVLSLAIPYWALKVLVAAFDTPFAYLGVKWLRGK